VEMEIDWGSVDGEVVAIFEDELVGWRDGKEEEEEGACEETRCETDDDEVELVELGEGLGEGEAEEDLCALDVLDTDWEDMRSWADDKKKDRTKVVETNLERIEGKEILYDEGRRCQMKAKGKRGVASFSAPLIRLYDTALYNHRSRAKLVNIAVP